ncbi:MAG: amino acid ABC transporter substrate-binding protein [Ruminococcaceae bacterium]|nr:amino acid ABC transporter substrate-binding protein [Oscillospiraceae bacterium]
MKKFLKVASIVLVIAMLACFASCGGNGDEKEKLIMATNAAFPPYEYKEGDKIVGIDAEIAEAIAKELGMELEIIDTEFGSIVGGVQSGKYDIGMAGMTVTEDRLKSVNFSTSYAKGVQSVIVLEDSKYTSYEDFYTGYDKDGNPNGVIDDLKIGVQQDTTGDIYASDKPEKWGFGEDSVIRYKTGADAVQALIAGKVDCVIIDNEPAKSFVEANEGLKILKTSYVEEDYAIAIAKEDTELLEKINAALEKLTDDGTIPGIIEKYIPAK